MRTKTAKLISALAMAGVLAFSSTAVYAEEAVSTAAEPQTLETYCPTNDDEEFPFNMEINVMPGSIQYIDLEEPIYGYESVLDEEALIFDVNFSLKDEFKDCDNYEFQVYSSDYSEKIASEYLGKDEVLTLSGLSIGEGYKIGMTLESESLTASYGGQFVIQAEWNGSLSVDLFYQLAHMEGDAAPYANEDRENNGANNTIEHADQLYYSRIMRASTYRGDNDYFKSVAPIKYADDDPDEEDRTGVVNLKYTFNLEPGAKICIEFFDKNQKSIRKYETDGSVTQIFCRFANVDMGTIYIINVTSIDLDEDELVEYTLTSGYEFALAWYGQFVSKDGKGVYWNADKLNDLYYGSLKIFSEKGGKYSSWFGTACGVAASAMALRNIGATLNGYDFRTDYRGDLQADPFTVMLANCLEDGTKMNPTSKSFINSCTHDPNELYSNHVAEKFGKSKDSHNVEPDKNIKELTGSTYEENLIRNFLKKYKYVVIYFNYDIKDPHFMLLTNLASGSGSFAESATVCDPAAMSYSKGIGSGQGIKLSETDWYNTRQTLGWKIELSSFIAYY